MSCDEAVLRALGPEVKQAYSLSLVRFAAGRRFPAAGPLAFGESGAGSRVKNILNWRQARTGIVFLAASLAAAVAVCCCTNAQGGSWVRPENTDSADAQFTCRLTAPVRSWAIYQDLFRNGAQVSSVPVVTSDAVGKFSGRLHYEIDSREGSFAGPLRLTYTDSLGASADWETALPESAYTACGSSPGTQGRLSLSPGDGGQTLLSIFFSDQAGGAFRAGPDVSAANALTVRYRLQVSSGAAAQFSAESADGTALARSLYALRNPYTGDAAADGKLLAALLDGGAFPPYTLELFTSGEPYALQVNFDRQPGTPGLTGPVMTRASFVLLALMENLGEVRWSWDGGQTAAVTLDTEQADAYLASAGAPDVKSCGASEETLAALLSVLEEQGRNWSAALFEGDTGASPAAGAVGTLTLEPADSGAPYPASFGALGQFGCSLPSGARYTLSAVTYLNGESLGETELTQGSADDLGGAFWFSCFLDEGSWDALHWTLYPQKDPAQSVELETPLPGHARSYSSRAFSWYGGDAAGSARPISGRTPLMAVCAAGAGEGDAACVPCETLTDPAAPAELASRNALTAVVYLTVSGAGAAETALAPPSGL